MYEGGSRRQTPQVQNVQNRLQSLRRLRRQTEMREMCAKCCAVIKREKKMLEKTEKNFEKWLSLWQNGKTTEPFWKFNKPKRKATVAKKPKSEVIWEEIVKADGRPFKKREDYNSDEEFKKERKLAEYELDSNSDLFENEMCDFCAADKT